MTLALETQGLRKSFGGVLVIDDLSISVDEGEALGIVGPNGAGKTTWFNLITGAVHADGGKVFFQGRDISHLSKHGNYSRFVSISDIIFASVGNILAVILYKTSSISFFLFIC